jgi:hypothetical protein
MLVLQAQPLLLLQLEQQEQPLTQVVLEALPLQLMLVLLAQPLQQHLLEQQEQPLTQGLQELLYPLEQQVLLPMLEALEALPLLLLLEQQERPLMQVPQEPL